METTSPQDEKQSWMQKHFELSGSLTGDRGVKSLEALFQNRQLSHALLNVYPIQIKN